MALTPVTVYAVVTSNNAVVTLGNLTGAASSAVTIDYTNISGTAVSGASLADGGTVTVKKGTGVTLHFNGTPANGFVATVVGGVKSDAGVSGNGSNTVMVSSINADTVLVLLADAKAVIDYIAAP